MANDSQKGGFRNVILLSVVSFLNDLSSEMIMPILPMFLQSLGASGQIIGLAGGLRESISNILKVMCGYWSDRTGRRKVFVYAGYVTSAVFKLLLGVCTGWTGAVGFSAMERIGKGLRTAARDAIIADSVTSQRGRGFGIHRGVETAGAVLGAAVAFGLLWFFALSFRSIIIAAAVIGFAAIVPLRFVGDTGSEAGGVTQRQSGMALTSPLRLFILVSAVFALGNFGYMFFVMRAQQLFAGRWAVAAPILLYLLFNIFYSALAVPLGVLSDRIGREKVIMLGYLLFSLTAAGFALFESLPAFVVLFALYGVVFAAIDGNQRALVSDLAEGRSRATALGAFHTVTGLAALPGGLSAGFLWEKIGPGATFVYGAVLSFISVLLLVVFKGRFRSADAAH